MKRAVIILLHIGYWAAYLLLLTIFYGLMNMDRVPRIMPGKWFWTIMVGFAILPGVLGFYTAYYRLFRRYFARKKILKLTLAIILVSVIATIIGEITMYFSLPARLFKWNAETYFGMGICIAINSMLNVFMGLLLKGFINGYDDIHLKEQLAGRNQEMELALLKSRINPHFLFNTINNIDVLIQQDAGRASDYLNKLSNLLRFVLYEAKTEQIPLTKELAYIDEYLELQSIRSSNPDYVSYDLEGNPGNWSIAPMLFIPFIENAFKHAENKRVTHAVALKISVEDDQVIFECRNAYRQNASAAPEEPGIGNSLIQKRLMLLYPGRHKLEISTANYIYHIKLIIYHEQH